MSDHPITDMDFRDRIANLLDDAGGFVPHDKRQFRVMPEPVEQFQVVRSMPQACIRINTSLAAGTDFSTSSITRSSPNSRSTAAFTSSSRNWVGISQKWRVGVLGRDVLHRPDTPFLSLDLHNQLIHALEQVGVIAADLQPVDATCRH